MMNRSLLMAMILLLLIFPLSMSETTSSEPSTETASTKVSTSEAFSSTVRETTSTTSQPTSPQASTSTFTTPKPTSTTTTTATTSTSTSTTTTTTSQPQSSTEWQDIEEVESEKLVNFVVSEIQKLKMEHKELDECQELDLSSVLSGKKLNGKVIKYSVTLKVQPQVKNTEECLQQNGTMNNLHPEICEADVTEGDRGGTDGKTLLRSTCLQVEELQD